MRTGGTFSMETASKKLLCKMAGIFLVAALLSLALTVLRGAKQRPSLKFS